jgi:hypothetical protein
MNVVYIMETPMELKDFLTIIIKIRIIAFIKKMEEVISMAVRVIVEAIVVVRAEVMEVRAEVMAARVIGMIDEYHK